MMHLILHSACKFRARHIRSLCSANGGPGFQPVTVGFVQATLGRQRGDVVDSASCPS